jgi:hypothetical protein
MTEMNEGVNVPKSASPNVCSNHIWDCTPHPQKGGQSIDDHLARLDEAKKEGDPFEKRAVEHNRKDIHSGDDIGVEFRCKNKGCSATKEVDHITRSGPGGPITKIVQCKSDQSKVNGGKGVTIKPKQLREDRKLRDALDACQQGTGAKVQIEYKLEAGDAANAAADFLRKNEPPLIQMVQ